MAELPTGTITMLFSELEGSAALLGRLGDRYGQVLSAHRALQHAAFSDCAGHELETHGDGFFVVFGSAADAVRSCVAAQRALAGHAWPEDAVVRVRMGLHSGEPARHEGGYVGLEVHRAARIAAAAHGGQVVLSGATRLLAQSGLPAGASLDDLGWHRLKDIDAPERIYQLTIAGLPARFPPLKSLGAPTSLPVPVTPLVGRDSDLDRVCAALARPGVRLMTLTGTGGVGKTRLAVAAAASLARAFPHGVFFAGLAAVRDAEVMWKTIAGDLDAGGDGPADEIVAGYLRERHALLVLDNLEQLDGAAGVVAALLAAAPRLVVLATSRRPLHIQGEHEYPVPPLAFPAQISTPEVVAASAAARLFVQQADLVRPGFAVTAGNAADIAGICRRLDGLPLAIELAAARVRLLAPGALLARLGGSLDLAAADVGRPSRQQTLRNTLGWSYELLPRDLAGAFRRMGVFAGGCDLDALAAVAAARDGPVPGAVADPLQVAAGLLDVCLVTMTEGADGEPRVGMLETVREYALERLGQAGELDEARRRHAGYYADLAGRARAQLFGPAHVAALNQLESELDNLRAALTWSMETRAARPAEEDRERVAVGLRLAQALTMFWYQHGHGAEGRRWLERAVELASDDGGAPLARVAHGLGMLLQQQGDFDGALRALERSLAIWRDLGDSDRQVRVLNSLGITYFQLGDLEAARPYLEGSIAISRELRNPALVSMPLVNLGHLEIEAGNLDRARQLIQEAFVLHQEEGDLNGVVNAQESLALVSLLAGRAAEARDLLSRTFGYAVSSGDTQLLVNIIEASACIAAELGECRQAARLAGAAEAIRQAAGMPIPEPNAAMLERFLGPARVTVPGAVWDAELAAGRALSQEEAVTLLVG